MFSISESVHPDYDLNILDWEKYRDIKVGGDAFIEKYTRKFSVREGNLAFLNRKAVSPNPAFASAAIKDIKNAIFQRIGDITREGGSASYQDFIKGLKGGVDRKNATISNFIGCSILPELLFLSKVGVYVDMPSLQANHTLADAKEVHPYFYMYTTEQIKNWTYTNLQDGIVLDKLLLEEIIIKKDEDFGLPDGDMKRYRLLERKDGVVLVRFFNEDDKQVDLNNELTTEVIELKIKNIPFVLFELQESLLKDIANHQIALLNLESSDINFTLLANFPFYTEQTSGITPSTHLKDNEESTDDGPDITVGVVQGRSYGKTLDRPGFIHPPSEPLMASMEKQKYLKDDIRALVQLALSNVRPKYASAEAKQMDERGLESGLSFIGQILEQGERELAIIVSEYEGDSEIATIQYPTRYELKSVMENVAELDSYVKLMETVPSKTYNKEIAKHIAVKLLGTRISNEDLTKILAEIKAAKYSTTEREIIHTDLDKGLVSTETASLACGYDKEEAEKAKIDHAERLARIKESQSADARGNADDSANSDGAQLEKTVSQNPDNQDDAVKPVRK